MINNPNAKLALIKVAEWLEAGAPHVVVDASGRKLDSFDMEYGVNRGGCGTSCCIAGAVVQFEGLGELDQYGSMGFFDKYSPTVGVDVLTSEFISEDTENLDKLFLPWNFYEPEDGESDDETGPFSQPQLAAKVIRHYVETGDIDWTIVGFVEKSE